jgi:hypothetical protein
VVFFVRGVPFFFVAAVLSVVAAAGLSGDLASVISVFVLLAAEDLALRVLLVFSVLAVVSEGVAASVAVVELAAVFDLDLVLPVFVLPVDAVASVVLAVSVEAAVEAFFFLDVDFLVVAFLAVPVMVVVVV